MIYTSIYLKFQVSCSFETDGQRAKATQPVLLIEDIYILFGVARLLLPSLPFRLTLTIIR